jgi:hypothetical protein
MAFSRKISLAGFGLLTTLGLGAGCQTNAGNGALIGGAAGAGLGAVVGHRSHGNTAGGAIVGGALGAITGAIVGSEVDRQQDRDRYYDGRDRYYDDRYYSRPGYVYEYRVWRDYGPYGPGYYTIREYRY